MATEFTQLRDFTRILGAVRADLDRRPLLGRGLGAEHRRAATDISLALEAARLALRSFQTGVHDQFNEQCLLDAKVALSEASGYIEAFGHSGLDVRLGAMLPKSLLIGILDRHRLFNMERMPLRDILNMIIDSISKLETQMESPNRFETEEGEPTRIERIRSLLPGQKVAPVQFRVVEQRLVIVKTSSRFDPNDASSVTAARDQLLAGGNRILEELRRSNCDRRLVETLEQLQFQLETDENIVKIGITNIGCETAGGAFAKELPDAVSAMLQAHTRAVYLFAGQFPDWNRFLENAASVHLTMRDIEKVSEATSKLIERLEARPEIVDPAVPATLAALLAFLRAPRDAAKKAAFSLLRSIENLVSSIYEFGVIFFEKTMKKTLDDLSTAAARTIVASLLALALSGATGIGPLAGKIGEMTWLRTATELVRDQIQRMGH